MSRLEELLMELCPEGVEFRSLSVIFNTRNGYTPSKANPDFWENGTVPWFRMEDIRTNGRILNDAIQKVSKSAVKGDLFPANSIIIATSATIGEHALLTVESLANQRFTYLTLKPEYKHRFDMKFLFYYCFKLDAYCLECLKQSNFSSVDMKKFSKFPFPIPPLPVQREIVRILDSFTELTAELIAELTAELTSRKKQYEYYRELVLFSGNNSQVLRIADIASVSIGEFVHKNKQQPDGQYPVYNGGITNTGYYDNYNREANKIIISARGANAGYVNRVFTKYWSGNSCYTIDVTNEHVDWNYVYHWLKANEQKLIGDQQKGGIPAVSKKQVENFQLIIPEKKQQMRIVSILETFEIMNNDISSGLPAEITARQKQYEYYRDKLLTFKKSEVSP